MTKRKCKHDYKTDGTDAAGTWMVCRNCGKRILANRVGTCYREGGKMVMAPDFPGDVAVSWDAPKGKE